MKRTPSPSDAQTVIRDFHAGLSPRDPFDDLAVLVAEVERLRVANGVLLDQLADGPAEPNESDADACWCPGPQHKQSCPEWVLPI